MKRLALIIAIMATALTAVNALAHMNEGAGKMAAGEKYEMMAPGGEHMMGPGIMGQKSDECWMGGSSMMGGQMHGWIHGGFILIRLIVVGFFFWLLFSIHKSLKVIADSKVTKE